MMIKGYRKNFIYCTVLLNPAVDYLRADIKNYYNERNSGFKNIKTA